MKKNLWMTIHEHRFGTDTYITARDSKDEPTQKQIITLHNIYFDPDRIPDCESIETTSMTDYNIKDMEN